MKSNIKYYKNIHGIRFMYYKAIEGFAYKWADDPESTLENFMWDDEEKFFAYLDKITY